MKINEKDFKHLVDGKEFVSILKKLNSLPKGGNPHPYFERLMILISSRMAQDIVPILYPYLVAFATESDDFAYINFLVNMKLGFYLRGDMNRLSDEHIREYLGGMYHMRTQMGMIAPKEDLGWPDEFKSMYLWNGMMLYSHSPDLLLLSRQGHFDKAFKVKCPCCGNDVHSLCIDVKNPENMSKITPCDLPEKSGEVLFFDDIMGTFWHIFHDFGEEYFVKVLPYVYGSYECTKCHETSRVADAMKCEQFENDPPFRPTEELMKRLNDIILEDFSVNVVEKWMIICYSVSLHRQYYGLNSMRALWLPVQAARMFETLLDEEGRVHLLLNVEKCLEIGEGSEEDRVNLLMVSSDLMADMWLEDENSMDSGKILAYCDEASEVSKKVWGGEDERTKMAEMSAVVLRGLLNPEEEIVLLEEFYNQLDGNTYGEVAMRMENYLYSAYQQVGDFDKVLQYKKAEIDHIMENIGDDSVEAAFLISELGDIYGEAEDYENARISYEKVIGYLKEGDLKEYGMPSLLSDFSEGKKKLKIKDDSEITPQIWLLHETLLALGDMDFEEEKYAEALGQYERATELVDWVFEGKYVASGVNYVKLASVYEKMGDKKRGKDCAEKAVKVLKIRLKQSDSEEELHAAQHFLDDAEEIVARI